MEEYAFNTHNEKCHRFFELLKIQIIKRKLNIVQWSLIDMKNAYKRIISLNKSITSDICLISL